MPRWSRWAVITMGSPGEPRIGARQQAEHIEGFDAMEGGGGAQLDRRVEGKARGRAGLGGGE